MAILSLALGIGANTAIFSLVDRLILRALPVSDPDRLVMVVDSGRPQGAGFAESWSNPVWEELRERLDRFDGVPPLSASGVSPSHCCSAWKDPIRL